MCYISNGRSALRILFLSTFRVLALNYYLVCSLSIHKICVLCGIFSAISVLLTTENSAYGWVKVIESCTSEFLTCHYLLVMYLRPYRVPFMRYSLR